MFPHLCFCTTFDVLQFKRHRCVLLHPRRPSLHAQRAGRVEGWWGGLAARSARAPPPPPVRAGVSVYRDESVTHQWASAGEEKKNIYIYMN